MQITNIVPMLLAHLRNTGSFSFVSGIDRFFLAPELNLYDVSEQNDVWSLGAILYMMVTGGAGNKRTGKAFEFTESIWSSVSGELKQFLMRALVVQGTLRASIDELLDSDFIRKVKDGSAQNFIIMETKLSTHGYNLYRF